MQPVAHAGFSLENVSLSASCGSAKPFMCPCCGRCIAAWAVSGRNQPQCPYCRSVDRQRSVCYVFLTDPPQRLRSEGAFVAYFGPDVNHSKALQHATPRMHLQEFDYFASGYRYARTTVFADVQKIPLQNSSLDGIIILHVLEHVPSLDTALRELKRVLLPGGFLQHDMPCCAEDSGVLNPCLTSPSPPRTAVRPLRG